MMKFEKIKQKYSNCITFYPANAYSLLGLIYLKENNLKQAQNMFKSALDLEHSKNRSKGAIIDYNNLAEISLKLGNKKTAQKYLSCFYYYSSIFAAETAARFS